MENLMIGRLAARAVIGGLFIGHGTQKLFGWFDGPGTLSLDRALGIEKTGPGWALATLGAGVLASAATIELARHHAPPEEDSRQAADDPELATVRT
jgi:putative oxidoreductase